MRRSTSDIRPKLARVGGLQVPDLGRDVRLPRDLEDLVERFEDARALERWCVK
jgi:hypothetical protein